MTTALERFTDRWRDKAATVLVVGAVLISPATSIMTWASKAMVEAATPEVVRGRAVIGSHDAKNLQEIAERLAAVSAGAAALERTVIAASDHERTQLAREVDAMFEAVVMAEDSTAIDRYDRVMLAAERNTSEAIQDAVQSINERKARLVRTALDLKTFAAAVAIDDAELAEETVATMKQRNAYTGAATTVEDREFKRRLSEYGERAAEAVENAKEWRTTSGPVGIARVLP